MENSITVPGQAVRNSSRKNLQVKKKDKVNWQSNMRVVFFSQTNWHFQNTKFMPILDGFFRGACKSSVGFGTALNAFWCPVFATIAFTIYCLLEKKTLMSG